MKNLQEKIRKGEYSGGSGSKPPGGGGSGGGGGGSSGGSEDGMSDEALQIVFATIGFIFVVHSPSLALFDNDVCVTMSDMITPSYIFFSISMSSMAWNLQS